MNKEEIEAKISALERELNDCTTAMDSKKIVVNASFGKLLNKYSNLYAPTLGIQVTLSGQLSLLMLIEMIELAGIPVVSGNTDGIVIKCSKYRYEELNEIISMWEQITRFETEETQYSATYAANINNYIAVKLDGKCKLKGAYADPGLSKNPTNTICNDAIINLIVNNVPLNETIEGCTDITKFLTLRAVKGGAEKNGTYLGKVVRFCYRKGEKGAINYVTSGNRVPKSEGAWPMMDLPDTFPDWIDYERYVAEAVSMLYDIGYLTKVKQVRLI